MSIGIELVANVPARDFCWLRSDAGASYFVVFDELSGATCMFGGVPPWGLVAGAPPVPVVSGPVEPGD
jgi:hypothetical protein